MYHNWPFFDPNSKQKFFSKRKMYKKLTFWEIVISLLCTTFFYFDLHFMQSPDQNFDFDINFEVDCDVNFEVNQYSVQKYQFGHGNWDIHLIILCTMFLTSTF